MNLVWVSTSINPCPSCAALNGQVHSAAEWGDLKPKDAHLYCQEHCTCHFEETDMPANGSISDAPLRLQTTERIEPMQKDFTLKATASPTEGGFEILAISEGEAKGHGIRFTSAVLQEAMPMYDSKPVFIDHAGLFDAPSVRNLAGTITAPAWDDRERGIRLTLKPAGPAADILLSVRDAAKTDPAIMQAVGFSTVLRVNLEKDGNVKKIVHVKSVDVVVDPARGGKFLSAYQTGQKGEQMTDHTKEQSATLTEQQTAALELQGANEIIADLQEKQKQANALQIEQCRTLLDSSLAVSKLPAASQKALRKPFDTMLAEGKPFLATQLQEAIKEKREELAALSDASSIAGPARISNMVNSEDQFRIAMTDLLGAERDEADKGTKVHRLTGIREAYLMATGDQSFIGGFFRDFALVTANFPGIVANIQNKMLLAAWKDFEQHYGWWKKIATVEHFNNLNDVAWIRTGTIASLPTVAERGEYTELTIGDNKETDSFDKYGGYIPLTIEAVLRDDIRAFRRMPREIALAGIRNISEQVAAIFTTNSAAGPTLADTGALFNSTAVTTAGGHANLLTTALGTDYVAWNAVAKAVFDQPLLVKNATGYYGTGKKIAIDPSYVLVPRALKNQAEALFLPRWEAQAQNVATVSPSWGGRVEVLTVPEWTDATDWAAAVDPKLMPGIMIGEIFGVEPQIFSASSEIDPAMFANDESRIKVRQFLAVGVADFRPLHKSNVA